MINTSQTRPKLEFLAQPVGAWPAPSFQVVSLLDMLPFAAEVFYLQCSALRDNIEALTQQITQRGLEAQTTESDAKQPLYVCRNLHSDCEQIGLARSVERLQEVEFKLTRVEHGYPLTALVYDLKELDRDISRDLGDKLFICLQEGEEALYEKPEMFGPEVRAKFPKANREITIAGTCYAMNDYAGCVFHLMRAVEYGARAVLKALGVQIYDNRPIELCDWGDLKKALENEIPQLATGKRRNEQIMSDYEFYSYPIQEFGKFIVWRNKVSHLRGECLPGQTKDIMDATERYMRHLAIELIE